MDRVKYVWAHRWSKTYQQTIFYNTYLPKEPPPYNLTFYKGELHGLFSRRFVEFIVESEVGQTYLEWCWDSGHPSEHYWNVLNYNRHLNAPGGYIGSFRNIFFLSFLFTLATFCRYTFFFTLCAFVSLIYSNLPVKQRLT